VLTDVNRRWLSVGAARKAFGVAVAKAPNGIDYVLDEIGTARLRKAKGKVQTKKVGRKTTAVAGRKR